MQLNKLNEHKLILVAFIQKKKLFVNRFRWCFVCILVMSCKNKMDIPVFFSFLIPYDHCIYAFEGQITSNKCLSNFLLNAGPTRGCKQASRYFWCQHIESILYSKTF